MGLHAPRWLNKSFCDLYRTALRVVVDGWDDGGIPWYVGVRLMKSTGIFCFLLLSWFGLSVFAVQIEMGVQGDTLSQTLFLPAESQELVVGTWYAPGLPSELILIPISPGLGQLRNLIPLSQHVPSISQVATRKATTVNPPVLGSLDRVIQPQGSVASTPPGATSTTPSSPSPPGTGAPPPIAPGAYDALSFNDAFAQARADLGDARIFKWQGGRYTTCYQGDPNLADCEAQAFASEIK
jgi:hypothetical protein